MDDRYRWNEERRRYEEKRADGGDNHAWDGREPFPKDLGGENHPGEVEPGLGLDPLTGDRGSGSTHDAATEEYYGVEVGGRPDGYSAGEAVSAPPVYGQRYVEGGFEEQRSFDPREPEGGRTFWNKLQDEVKSWMGDRDAGDRRHHDHDVSAEKTPAGGDWKGHDDDTGWRDPLSAAPETPSEQTAEAKEHRPGWFRDEP